MPSGTSLLPCFAQHLESEIRQHPGLKPKEFSTIRKVRHMADLPAQRKKKESRVQTAFENGFYDQAHFIRIFAGGGGLTSPGKSKTGNYLMPFRMKLSYKFGISFILIMERATL
jgi:hypothetical protein